MTLARMIPQFEIFSIIILQAMALLMFASSYFQWQPLHYSSKKFSESKNKTIDQNCLNFFNESNEQSPIIFDKIVFMVIDAFRSDFVYDDRFSSAFSWVNKQKQSKRFIARARAPTVTLPRLRALVAGTAPKFLDLLTNLDGSAQIMEDAWPKNAKTLHYGDDTWMRLFPDLEGEGVHSFFVTDTIEVDRNVTRHLPEALSRSDWQVLSLHYLGLDHVGHVGGIQSPLLIPKLREMDHIIENIYNQLEQNDAKDGTKSALITLGDHGMMDNGNHGGASREEIETGCIFFSPHYPINENSKISIIEQVDIAPTISALLGIDIPTESTGKIILNVFPDTVTMNTKLSLLRKNACQLSNLSGDSPNLSDLDGLLAFISGTSLKLAISTGEYDVGILSCGILLMALSMFPLYAIEIGLLVLTCSINFIYNSFLVKIASLILILTSLALKCKRLMFGRSVLHFDFIVQKCKGLSNLDFVSLIYALTQFSSTFIEEEHFFWNFAVSSCLILSAFKQKRCKDAVLPLLLFRSLIYWNSTGYLYRDDPDVRKLFIVYSILGDACWVASLLYLVKQWKNSVTKGFKTLLPSLLFIVTCSKSFWYKMGFSGGVVAERQLLILSFSLLIVSWIIQRHTFRIALTLFYLIFSKTHNAIPLVVLYYLSSNVANDDHVQKECLSLASFFLLGPSHLIAAIDFTPAYVGVKRFGASVPILALLLIWAGPFVTMQLNDDSDMVKVLRRRSFINIIMLTSLFIQRNHLFVWTVFAPRLLFELGWFLYFAIRGTAIVVNASLFKQCNEKSAISKVKEIEALLVEQHSQI